MLYMYMYMWVHSVVHYHRCYTLWNVHPRIVLPTEQLHVRRGLTTEAVHVLYMWVHSVSDKEQWFRLASSGRMVSSCRTAVVKSESCNKQTQQMMSGRSRDRMLNNQKRGSCHTLRLSLLFPLPASVLHIHVLSPSLACLPTRTTM